MDKELIEKCATALCENWSREALKAKLVSERQYGEAEADALLAEADKIAKTQIQARRERQKIAAEERLAEEKAAEERRQAEVAAKIKKTNNQALATLGEFGSDFEKIWISAGTLDKVEAVFQNLIGPAVLEKGNTLLSQQHHKRALTYRDYAFLYCAHRKNVHKNKGGASPMRGIVGWSKKATEQGLIAGEFSHVHIAMVLKVFQALELTICNGVADHQARQAAQYRILPHPELDELLWN
jgi:hypothetical protein